MLPTQARERPSYQEWKEFIFIPPTQERTYVTNTGKRKTSLPKLERVCIHHPTSTGKNLFESEQRVSRGLPLPHLRAAAPHLSYYVQLLHTFFNG